MIQKIKRIIRTLVLSLLVPITKILGHIYFAPKLRAIKRKNINAIEMSLMPGDILLSYSKGELSNYFIDGEYKHCGLWSGRMVIEATSHNVVASDLDDFCASKDKICIVRPLFCDYEQCRGAVSYAESQIGAPYDYLFKPNDRAFYCAELITRAYSYATKSLSPFLPREIMGVKTVMPVDFKLATKKFSIILEV